MQKKGILLCILLTLGLTNCAKNKGNSDVALELEEPFSSDEISQIPLEESDLIALSDLGIQYYAVEIAPFIRTNAENKFSGKVSQNFHYDKSTHSVNTSLIQEQKVSGTETYYEQKNTYNSVAPFNLINSKTITTIKSKNSNQDQNIEMNIECDEKACLQNGISNGKKLTSQRFLRSQYSIENLKELILENLITRHQIEVKKIRLNILSPNTEGLIPIKKIYYAESSLNEPRKINQISRTFNPHNPIPYSFDKNSTYINRQGLMTMILNEMTSVRLVSEGNFQSLNITELDTEHLNPYTTPPSNKIDFVRLLIKGANRYQLKNNTEQVVNHYSEWSEIKFVEADSNEGTPDKTPPNATEKNLPPNIKIDNAWLKTLDPIIAKSPNTQSKANAIYNFVIQNIRYSTTNGFLTSEELLDLKKGDCSELAKAFVILARHYEIGARRHGGYVVHKGSLKIQGNGTVSADMEGSHAWANYYDEERKQWFVADPALHSFDSHKGWYAFDKGIDSPNDLEVEDYSFDEGIVIKFVFDQASKEEIEKSFTPSLFDIFRKMLK